MEVLPLMGAHPQAEVLAPARLAVNGQDIVLVSLSNSPFISPMGMDIYCHNTTCPNRWLQAVLAQTITTVLAITSVPMAFVPLRINSNMVDLVTYIKTILRWGNIV